VFLGRSKAEQYFGFLPFFTYINFIIGYVPLVLSDATSQLILSVYIVYVFTLKYFYNLTNLFTNNLIDIIEVQNTNNTNLNTNKPKLNVSDLFLNKNVVNSNTQTPLLSKALNITQSKLSLVNYSITANVRSKLLTSNVLNNTIKFKSSKLNPIFNNNITLEESTYLNINTNNNFKIKNTTINLSDLNKIRHAKNYPLFFNFNLESNLNLSKQQRWLTKNSLLTESLINNSFLITQAKNLIGSGLLDKDFSSKTL
jgi:hypothetical protein